MSLLRQWPIVFAILALLAIQMQYGTAHLTWKGHGFSVWNEGQPLAGPKIFFWASKILESLVQMA